MMSDDDMYIVASILIAREHNSDSVARLAKTCRLFATTVDKERCMARTAATRPSYADPHAVEAKNRSCEQLKWWFAWAMRKKILSSWDFDQDAAAPPVDQPPMDECPQFALATYIAFRRVDGRHYRSDGRMKPRTQLAWGLDDAIGCHQYIHFRDAQPMGRPPRGKSWDGIAYRPS